MLFTSQWTGDNALPLRWGLVAGSHSQIHVSPPVIIFKKNSGSLLSLSGMSWHVRTWISFCSSPSRQGTSLVTTTYIFILSFKMLWGVPNKIPNAFWTSQTEILLFFEDKFPTQSTYSSVLLTNGHPNVQHLLHCFWTSKTTQKPRFFQLPVLQKLPPTFWKFLYYFYQFKPKFNADMLFRYTKIANGTTHVCTQTDITTVQSQVPQFHSKQAVTQQPQHHLHSMGTVCASSSRSVICTDNTPLCYLNSVIPYTNTTTVIIKPVPVFTKFATCFSQ